MSLEDRVNEMMDEPIASHPVTLQAVAGKPQRDLLAAEVELLKAQLVGVRHAVEFLGRTLDQR